MKMIIIALVVILSLMVISGCVPTTTTDDMDFSDELSELDDLESDLDISDLDALDSDLAELEQAFS